MASAHSPRVLRFGVGSVLLGATLGAAACDRGAEGKPGDDEKTTAEAETSPVNEAPSETGGAVADDGAQVDGDTGTDGNDNDDSSIPDHKLEPRTNVGRELKRVEPVPVPETNIGREQEPPAPQPLD